MVPFIRCPCCTKPLGNVNDDGSLQAHCPSCHRNFGVVYGKLSGRSSRWEAMLYLTAKLPSFYKRRYEFRIITPGRDLKVLRFSTPGRGDKVPVHLGDRISFLYSTQGSVMQKLIAVSNHTIGKTYRLPAPVPSANYLFQLLGTAAVGVFFFVLLTGYASWVTLSLGTIALWLATRVIDAAQLTTPVLQNKDRTEARLIEEREIMSQKMHLEERVESLRHEGIENRALIKRLQALRTKMQSFNPSLYKRRIDRIDRAITLLQHRTQHDRHLTEQYGQTIQMIDIELETAYLVDQMPDAHDFSGTILRKLAELKAIEERNSNLRLELEANEEVRRLSGE